ncbi:MAG: nucleoside triphosphate pyrophosphohydrolase [Clostridiales bacterium]|nr:nucleoside triphosphate pyrophosphohydrolase [Clostridiales bacterium]
MGKITIVGLGPGSLDDITLKALKTIENSKCLYLRTKIHPTVKYLDDMGIIYKSFDDYYDKFPAFEKVYEEISKQIIDMAREHDVTYAVPGNPLVAEDTVQMILSLAKQSNIDVDIVQSVSFIDAVIKALPIDPIDGLTVMDGLQIANIHVDTSVHNIITQVYNRKVASDVKLKLMDYYKDEQEVTMIHAAGVKDMERIEKMPLYNIDRVDWVDHLTSIYIPPAAKRRYNMEDLTEIMGRLRGNGGCPWDRKQTHESLKRYLIEESYEVLEAIDQKDEEKLCEELGDVLLQVVFHAQIAKEEGKFDLYDVTDKITDKMIKRHAHIFGNDVCLTAEDVIENWDKIKRKEQNHKTVTDVLKHVPKILPALMRSYKVQEKAAGVGFDFNNMEDAIKKINEELNELIEVYKSEEYGKIIEELGDLLFAVVNVCRFLNVMPEFALNSTTEKFIRRFEYIEKSAGQLNKKLEDMTLPEMDKLWNEAKMNNI